MLHDSPVPTLAYYRDADRQQRPTKVLFLKGASIEAHTQPAGGIMTLQLAWTHHTFGIPFVMG